MYRPTSTLPSQNIQSSRYYGKWYFKVFMELWFEKPNAFRKITFFMHAIAYVKKINEYLNKIVFQTLVWLSGQFIHTTLIWLNILACFWRRTLTFEDGNLSAKMMKCCSRYSAFFHIKKYNSSEKSLFQNMQHTFEFLGWSKTLSWKIFIYIFIWSDFGKLVRLTAFQNLTIDLLT